MIAASKKPVWLTLTIALVFHTAVISLQASRRVDTSFMRVWLLDSLAPAEKLTDRALLGVRNVWNGYFALVGLHRENDELRRRLDESQMQIEKQKEDVLEVQRLHSMLGYQTSIEARTIVARVVGRDASHWNQTVTIDKGRSHGVQPDSAVVTPGGIVGRVISAGNFFSIVQLIVDSQSAVGVMVNSNRRLGIVKGNGSGTLDLDYIDDDNEIKVGDEFITSGLDRIYPKGLPVGTIASIGPRPGLIKIVQIHPRADLGRLEEVFCVIDRPVTVDTADPAHDPLETAPLH